jgi:hypothetical protein
MGRIGIELLHYIKLKVSEYQKTPDCARNSSYLGRGN